MKPTPQSYPRDLVGYGRSPPHARWPGRARIALQFVLNHEEGSENCVLDGDAHSETFLSEIIGAAAFPMRHMSMESLFEYGSRARPRNCRTRAALDQLSARRRSYRACPPGGGGRATGGTDRRRAARLVHRTRQPEHPASARRARRLSL